MLLVRVVLGNWDTGVMAPNGYGTELRVGVWQLGPAEDVSFQDFPSASFMTFSLSLFLLLSVP